MKQLFPYAKRQCQGGSVTVEAAVCITFVLLPLLTFVFLFGRFFWYYTAAQKAVHDATLYMAGAPLSEIKSKAAVELAKNIILQETADFDLTTTADPSVDCGYKISPGSSRLAFGGCSSNFSPDGVQAFVIMAVPMPFLFDAGGSNAIHIVPIAAMRYVGN